MDTETSRLGSIQLGYAGGALLSIFFSFNLYIF